MTILLTVENDDYRQILSALACSRAEISAYEIFNFQSGTTTLKKLFERKFEKGTAGRVA